VTIGADPFPSAKPHTRPRKRNRILIIAACGLAFTALLSTLALWFVNGVGQTLGAGVRAAVGEAELNGAYQASAVTAFARSEGVSYGDLTIQSVQNRYANRHWLTSTEASTTTDGRSLSVSLDIEGSHVVTAVQVLAGICSYGLAVQSQNDPIVASDDLSGAGVFYAFIPLNSFSQSTCSAATAPKSEWITASPAAMKDASDA
jgi:hypothetical protein